VTSLAPRLGTVEAASLPALVLTDDAQHGVSAYARRVAGAVEALAGRELAVAPDALTGTAPPARSHLHFTDRLWGGSPEEAADRIVDLAGRTSLTVTLHDLPQSSDGERNLPRRADCYRRVVEAVAGVVCNSRHEAALLDEHVGARAAGAAAVVPLSVDPVGGPVAPADRPEPDGTAAVIGFFYPGKGHAELVAAAAELADGGRALRVAALGRASTGHEGELAELVAAAAARGVELEVTGYLDDDALLERCRRATVPVAAHRHVSASGSVATWIAAGRRPIVPDTRYSREMAELRPGTLTLVDADDLVAALAAARDDPASTWLAPGAVTAPGTGDVAVAYARWWAGQVAR
jgi:hypothetical protein